VEKCLLFWETFSTNSWQHCAISLLIAFVLTVKVLSFSLLKLWLLLPCRAAALIKADSIRRRSSVWQTVHRSWWGHEAFVHVRTGKLNANSNYPSHGTLPSQLDGPNVLLMVKMSTTARTVLFYSAAFIDYNLLRLTSSFEAVNSLNNP
jgi:hypothetical protein